MNTLHSLHRGSAHKGEAPWLPQRLPHSSTTPAQEGLTMEFPPWFKPLYLQSNLQNLQQVLCLMNHSLESPLSSSIDKPKIFSTTSQIVILLSWFNCTFFESNSLTHEYIISINCNLHFELYFKNKKINKASLLRKNRIYIKHEILNK